MIVFTYAYLMAFNGKLPDKLPNGDTELPVGIPGYFVGDPKEPIKGNFEGTNNLTYALAKVAEHAPVEMNFEGLAIDDKVTLLLQPIQIDPKDYKTVDDLVETYML